MDLPRYRIGVVIRVADPRKSEGNLAMAKDFYRCAEGKAPRMVDTAECFGLTQEVWHPSEVFIVDTQQCEREVSYPGRKAHRWEIEVEWFDDIQKAAERSREIKNIYVADEEACYL